MHPVPADEIAAMDHGFGPLSGGRTNSAMQGLGPVMAVGDDADLHAPSIANSRL